jgi:GMP synthase (glutamine-hydrolysing)
VLVTGDPVPTVERARGPFTTLIRETLGDAWNGEVRTLDARHGELPTEQQTTALVITGSPESVTARSTWIVRAERAVANLVHAGVPTLGICFGHQLLGQALGGHVEVNPHGREMGTVEVELVEEDPLFAGFARTFSVNMSHRDSITRLPPETRVLGRSRLEPHAAVRFAPRAWGVQFHPEFDGGVMRGYIAARRATLTTEGVDPDALAATDAPAGAEVLRAFARLVRDSH